MVAIVLGQRALDMMALWVTYSTLPGNSYWSCTSTATPSYQQQLSGEEKNAGLKDSDIKNKLYSKAKDLGRKGWDTFYGVE